MFVRCGAFFNPIDNVGFEGASGLANNISSGEFTSTVIRDTNHGNIVDTRMPTDQILKL